VGVIEHLPATLTELKLSDIHEVPVKALKKLPPGLLTFTCFRLVGDVSNLEFWPPNLSTLEFSLPEGAYMSYKDPRWLQLPRTLTSLRLESFRHISFDVSPDMLPPLLKSHQARKLSPVSETFDYSHLKQLSSLNVTIVTLEEEEEDDYDGIFDQDEGVSSPPKAPNATETTSDLSELSLYSASNLPQSMRFILPIYLTAFRWICHHSNNPTNMPDRWYFRDSYVSWLPRFLETFYCDDARFLTNSFLQNLPRSLTSLTLDLGPKEVDVLLSSEGFKCLPPNLINLQSIIDPNTDDSFIQFLPPSLTSLTIERLKKLSNSSVFHLPRRLAYLHLPHVSHGLTDAGIPGLPKTLERLELEHNKTWTPEAFFAHKLPKLRFVDVRANPNFTKSKVTQLGPPDLSIKAKNLSIK
jgi:hypothetical protein